MTRKDYILIADAMRKSAHYPEATEAAAQHEHSCEMLANALAADNARFDRARFLTACGVAS